MPSRTFQLPRVPTVFELLLVGPSVDAARLVECLDETRRSISSNVSGFEGVGVETQTPGQTATPTMNRSRVIKYRNA
jgi:hypothetical protein